MIDERLIVLETTSPEASEALGMAEVAISPVNRRPTLYDPGHTSEAPKLGTRAG